MSLLNTIIDYYYAGAHFAAASTDGGVSFSSLCELTSDYYGQPARQRSTFDADDPAAPAVTCPKCVTLVYGQRAFRGLS